MEEKGEEFVASFYNDIWKDPRRILRGGDDLLLGFHFGYHDKGVHGKRETMLRMNTFVEELVDFSDGPKTVLDAGCGMGGTVLQLAKAHPDSRFYGITLGSEEVVHATSLQSRLAVGNVEFSQQSYLNTNFPDGFFDAIYALESVSCGIEDDAFLTSMRRMLKPDGKIIIIDTFPRITDTTLVDRIRARFLKMDLHDRPHRTIHSFRSCLSRAGFNVLRESDLKKQGHVRYVVFSFIGLEYLHVVAELKALQAKKPLHLPSLIYRFTTDFFFSIVLFYALDLGYFAIVGQKNQS